MVHAGHIIGVVEAEDGTVHRQSKPPEAPKFRGTSLCVYNGETQRSSATTDFNCSFSLRSSFTSALSASRFVLIKCDRSIKGFDF